MDPVISRVFSKLNASMKKITLNGINTEKKEKRNYMRTGKQESKERRRMFC